MISGARNYKVKLEKIYDHFLTPKGAAIARQRQAAAACIYENILKEVQASSLTGRNILQKCLESAL